jgi:hypothetical protein
MNFAIVFAPFSFHLILVPGGPDATFSGLGYGLHSSNEWECHNRTSTQIKISAAASG